MINTLASCSVTWGRLFCIVAVSIATGCSSEQSFRRLHDKLSAAPTSIVAYRDRAIELDLNPVFHRVYRDLGPERLLKKVVSGPPDEALTALHILLSAYGNVSTLRPEIYRAYHDHDVDAALQSSALTQIARGSARTLGHLGFQIVPEPSLGDEGAD